MEMSAIAVDEPGAGQLGAECSSPLTFGRWQAADSSPRRPGLPASKSFSSAGERGAPPLGGGGLPGQLTSATTCLAARPGRVGLRGQAESALGSPASTNGTGAGPRRVGATPGMAGPRATACDRATAAAALPLQAQGQPFSTATRTGVGRLASAAEVDQGLGGRESRRLPVAPASMATASGLGLRLLQQLRPGRPFLARQAADRRVDRDRVGAILRSIATIGASRASAAAIRPGSRPAGGARTSWGRPSFSGPLPASACEVASQCSDRRSAPARTSGDLSFSARSTVAGSQRRSGHPGSRAPAGARSRRRDRPPAPTAREPPTCRRAERSAAGRCRATSHLGSKGAPPAGPAFPCSSAASSSAVMPSCTTR